jgi:hypothetical protein
VAFGSKKGFLRKLIDFQKNLDGSDGATKISKCIQWHDGTDMAGHDEDGCTAFLRSTDGIAVLRTAIADLKRSVGLHTDGMRTAIQERAEAFLVAHTHAQGIHTRLLEPDNLHRRMIEEAVPIVKELLELTKTPSLAAHYRKRARELCPGPSRASKYP